MEEIITDVVTIDGKEYFLVESIEEYGFYAEISNPENISVLKEIELDGQNFWVSLEEDEFDKAMVMYYEKFGDAS